MNGDATSAQLRDAIDQGGARTTERTHRSVQLIHWTLGPVSLRAVGPKYLSENTLALYKRLRKVSRRT